MSAAGDDGDEYDTDELRSTVPAAQWRTADRVSGVLERVLAVEPNLLLSDTQGSQVHPRL